MSKTDERQMRLEEISRSVCKQLYGTTAPEGLYVLTVLAAVLAAEAEISIEPVIVGMREQYSRVKNKMKDKR